MPAHPSDAAQPPSEREKFEFEKSKFEREHAAKARLQADEVSTRNLQLWKSPLTLAVLGGIITLLAGTLSETLKSSNQLALEEEKFQADLIKKYLEVSDPEIRKGNLRFLAEAGLIPRYADKITGFINDAANTAPQTVPISGSGPAIGNFGADGRMTGTTLERLMAAKAAMVTVERRDQLIWTKCSGFLISSRHVLTADFCTRGSVAAGDGELRDIRLSGSVLADQISVIPSAVRVTKGLAVIALPVPLAGARPLVLSAREPTAGEPLMLVYSDPNGDFVASLDAECAVIRVTATAIAYRCDAAPGSAGGALLSAETGAVIAVHTRSDKESRDGIRVDGLPPLGEMP